MSARTVTVLIVEDEEMLLELLKAVLEEHGYRVLTAKDGLEAIDVFSSHKDEITLVISDMGLPKLGGWDAFQKMREIRGDAKVILASGYFDYNLKAEMVKAGAFDFIQKPYDVNALIKTIQKLISENGSD